MRERKLRSTAESLVRFRGSRIPYTYYIYKIQRKVKNKNTMRICSLSVPRLKHEWNQTVGRLTIFVAEPLRGSRHRAATGMPPCDVARNGSAGPRSVPQ